MFLGIEIGGTKLQLGLGPGDGQPFIRLQREAIDPQGKAEGIRQQIIRLAGPLIQEHSVRAVGIGFGGPVDALRGRTVTSHQVQGWDDFPLAQWCRDALGVPAVLSNDSDAAGLAEARFGAGKGRRVVFYSNVGSGIGGALVIDGRLHCGARGIASEIGQLRPGLQSEEADQTVESLASGWAIAAAARSLVTDPVSHRLGPFLADDRARQPEAVRQRLIEREEVLERCAGDLLERCGGKVDRLTTQIVAQAAAAGNEMAREVFLRACQAFGWALAQMITLLAPDVVVIGGGVSLVGEKLFLAPLRRAVDRYVFPPLAGTYQIVPAALGEEVVVHGVLALAAEQT